MRKHHQITTEIATVSGKLTYWRRAAEQDAARHNERIDALVDKLRTLERELYECEQDAKP